MFHIKLIFNADDFGLSKAVNYGIVEAFENGVVRSTTIMSNMPAFEHGMEILKFHKGLKTGIHLNLTMGASILKGHKTLTDENGNFHKQAYMFGNLDKIDEEEVYKEYSAQIERVLEKGVEITHLDGHHHFHYTEPCRKAYIELCKKYNVGARNYPDLTNLILENNIRTTTAFNMDFYGDFATEKGLLKILNKNKNEQSLEIMCHPAFVDAGLFYGTGYNVKRIDELAVLINENVKEYIKDNNMELVGFDALK